MPKYTVKQGDCISSIAYSRGFFWQTVWDENPQLQKKRDNPNTLLPGDEVIIPEKRLQEENCATEMCHSFRKRGEPAKFRLLLERNNKPLANKPFTLEIDGTFQQGETNEKGFLEVSILPNAKRGKLKIEDIETELSFGAIDPYTEHIGLQSRLKNLGFYDGELDGQIGDETKLSIKDFQAATGLPVTGAADQDTIDMLLRRHDQMHEPLLDTTDEAKDHEEADEDFSDDEEIEDEEIDEAEEEEMFRMLEYSDDEDLERSGQDEEEKAVGGGEEAV